MSDTLIVEKDNIQVVQINEKEIVVIEKGFSIVQNGGGSSIWGGITGNLADQTDLKNTLDDKVDKVMGKGLSTNDYTDLEKQNLSNQSGTNTGDETQSGIVTKIGYTPADDLKVVHKTGDETISGVKSFTSTIRSNQITTSGNVRIGGTSLNQVRATKEAIIHSFQI